MAGFPLVEIAQVSSGRPRDIGNTDLREGLALHLQECVQPPLTIERSTVARKRMSGTKAIRP